MSARIERKLSCYCDDDLAYSIAFRDFSIEEFQKEFGVEASDPMYDCYEVTESNAPFIYHYLPAGIEINWNVQKLSYFIEASQ